MSVSSELIAQLVKVTNDTQPAAEETTVYGTIVEYDGSAYVKLDGSELLTPITTTAVVRNGERVTVMIKNHTAVVTGNVTSPSAQAKDVDKVLDAADQIAEFELLVAYRVTTDELSAINATIENLKSVVANFGDVTAINAEIEKLRAEYASLDYVYAEDVEALNAKIENIQAMFGDFADVSTENLEAANAEIDNLRAYNADFTYVSADVLKAMKATIDKLDVESLNASYANIDFSNIGQAAIEKFFSKSGLIEDVVVGDGTITGMLVGVTIKGDLIEGGTVVADKLVIQGEDGLYYKLNTDGMKVEAKQTEYNSLNGSIITAKSITATKISVNDLVAFDATIGGFKITDKSIYSGVKSSVDNTTRGTYLDSDGQLAIGDGSNFIKYYKDANGVYKLAISASSIIFSSTNKTVQETIDNVQSNVDKLEIGGRNLLLNSSFSGYTNDDEHIYDSSERSVTYVSDTKGAVIGTYPRISDYGLGKLRASTITLSGEYKILSTLEYGTTNPWIGFQIGAKRDSTTGGSSQYISWLGGTTIGTEVTDGWVKSVSTYKLTDYDFSSVSVSMLFRDVIGSVAFRNLKIEFGSKPTDWTPAPEDMATADDNKLAQDTAEAAQKTASNAETLVQQLSDSISMLVTDGNGTSLMTQTESGWTFSTADIQTAVSTTAENLNTLTNELGDTNNTVNVLQQAVADLGEIAEYVKIGTYENEPCIELGEGDSEFKLRITNTRILFMEGSSIIAHFTNQSLHIKKAVIEEELQQGEFVWKARSNGNLGLIWKGVTS